MSIHKASHPGMSMAWAVVLPTKGPSRSSCVSWFSDQNILERECVRSEHPSLIRFERRPWTWQILSFQLRFLKECRIIQPRKQIAGKGWMNSLGRKLRFTTCALKAVMELENEFFMGHVYKMFSFYLLALWMEWKQLSSLLLPVRGWGPRSGWGETYSTGQERMPNISICKS